MRLIDADALADALFEKRKNYPQWVADTIGAMPDAIVQCKDCVKRNNIKRCPIERAISYISWLVVDVPDNINPSKNDNWFCADGERKDDG